MLSSDEIASLSESIKKLTAAVEALTQGTSVQSEMNVNKFGLGYSSAINSVPLPDTHRATVPLNINEVMKTPTNSILPSSIAILSAPHVCDEMSDPIAAHLSPTVAVVNGKTPAPASFNSRLTCHESPEINLVEPRVCSIDELPDVSGCMPGRNLIDEVILSNAQKVFDKVPIPTFMIEMAQSAKTTQGESFEVDRELESHEVYENHGVSLEYGRRMLAKSGASDGPFFQDLVVIGAGEERFSRLLGFLFGGCQPFDDVYEQCDQIPYPKHHRFQVSMKPLNLAENIAGHLSTSDASLFVGSSFSIMGVDVCLATVFELENTWRSTLNFKEVHSWGEHQLCSDYALSKLKNEWESHLCYKEVQSWDNLSVELVWRESLQSKIWSPFLLYYHDLRAVNYVVIYFAHDYVVVPPLLFSHIYDHDMGDIIASIPIYVYTWISFFSFDPGVLVPRDLSDGHLHMSLLIGVQYLPFDEVNVQYMHNGVKNVPLFFYVKVISETSIKALVLHLTLEDKGVFRGMEDTNEKCVCKLSETMILWYDFVYSRSNTGYVLNRNFDQGGGVCKLSETMILWYDFVYSRSNTGYVLNRNFDQGGGDCILSLLSHRRNEAVCGAAFRDIDNGGTKKLILWTEIYDPGTVFGTCSDYCDLGNSDIVDEMCMSVTTQMEVGILCYEVYKVADSMIIVGTLPKGSVHSYFLNLIFANPDSFGVHSDLNGVQLIDPGRLGLRNWSKTGYMSECLTWWYNCSQGGGTVSEIFLSTFRLFKGNLKSAIIWLSKVVDNFIFDPGGLEYHSSQSEIPNFVILMATSTITSTTGKPVLFKSYHIFQSLELVICGIRRTELAVLWSLILGKMGDTEVCGDVVRWVFDHGGFESKSEKTKQVGTSSCSAQSLKRERCEGIKLIYAHSHVLVFDPGGNDKFMAVTRNIFAGDSYSFGLHGGKMDLTFLHLRREIQGNDTIFIFDPGGQALNEVVRLLTYYKRNVLVSIIGALRLKLFMCANFDP